MPNENTVAAASYVLTVYRDIQYLTDYAAQYNNLVLGLSAKYGNKTALNDLIENLQENDKRAVLEVCQNTRFWVQRVYIQFSALTEKIPGLTVTKELEKTYRAIKGNIVPLEKDIEMFAILINKEFAGSIMGDLLIKSQQYYNELMDLNKPGGESGQ